MQVFFENFYKCLKFGIYLDQLYQKSLKSSGNDQVQTIGKTHIHSWVQNKQGVLIRTGGLKNFLKKNKRGMLIRDPRVRASRYNDIILMTLLRCRILKNFIT